MNDLIPMPEPAPEHGLTDLQQAFADNWIAGAPTYTAAAIAAGYSETSAKVQASRLMANTKVLAYIQAHMAVAIAAAAPKAMGRLLHLVENAKSDYVRLEAAKDLMDRAGFGAPKRVDARLLGDVTFRVDLS